jgi:hypothetical protein
MTQKQRAKKIREAVERVVNDRRGLHWEGLDASVLRDLREHVERVVLAVLEE